MPNLPIDAILPELRAKLRSNQSLVLQAPPGAGKTTRVPLALLDEDWLAGKSILMLEPRRLAASNAARYMARLLGEEVGQRVGYRIRYQQQVSRQTRIEVVTEGILTRRLQSDPELTGVGLVIFDEFHERHLHSDLALALCHDVQRGLREDLKLLVMSATLDGEPLARLLGAPLLTSAGRSYSVDIHYLPSDSGQQLVTATCAAVRRSLKETSGDLLVFLPGEGEIRRCREQLADLAGTVTLCPLYGSLPFTAQEQAILPGAQRKVVLATNIAETSLTIDGISVVIDSGYCRKPRYDAAAGGLTRLELARISQASATQRAGRAGRLGPGRCYRLWTEGTQGSLLPFTPPEIATADLAPLALELLAWGVADPAELSWLDPPAASGWQAALNLLKTLNAVSPQGQLTPHGRQLAQLPVHPRLAALLREGETQQLLPLACDLTALLSERDPWQARRKAPHSADCDLLERLEGLWQRQRAGRLEEFTAVDRAAGYWRRYFRLPPSPPDPGRYSAAECGRLLAAAFPDRIAKARQAGSGNYLLASGQGACLDQRSALPAPELLVAVELRGASGSAAATISLAGCYSKEQLFEQFAEPAWQRRCSWDGVSGRVIACEQQRFGELVLAERRCAAAPAELAEALLEGIRQEGLDLLNWTPAATELRARLSFLGRTFPEENWPGMTDAELLETLPDWLGPFLGTARSRAELGKIDLLAALRSRIDWQQLQRLDSLAPERLSVPSGSKIRLAYPEQGAPVLAVKLQEMFGQLETPRIAGGRVAVQVHLLSPAGRPLQQTQDLRHFWESSYHEVKKEMKGRYPKHPWPDDPLRAVPTAKTKRRS